MRQLALVSARVAMTAAVLTQPLSAQSSRDSAGVRIVENAQPVWKPSEQLSLASKPHLVIGDNADSTSRFQQIRGVIRLADGRIAVAEGGSMQLRIFSPEGRFLSASAGKGDAPGQLRNMGFVRHLPGDTIAIISGFSSVGLYSGTGQFVRTTALPSAAENTPSSRLLLLALLNNGLRVAAPLPRPTPRAIGSRWADSLVLKFISASNEIKRELGAFPYIELEQVTTGPMPPWLSAIGVFAGGDDLFYAGFGDRYAIRVYASDGTLQSIIRRSWTPTPVTPDDWEQWVVEWSKRRVKSTGAERERDVEKVRSDPWAELLPAFSEFIVDRSGRLWVREAHWQDAIGAGSLSDIPAVPSRWSVFDRGGRWLGDVSMPTDFQPFDIGTDYVAGKARSNGVNQVVIYPLHAGGK